LPRVRNGYSASVLHLQMKDDVLRRHCEDEEYAWRPCTEAEALIKLPRPTASPEELRQRRCKLQMERADPPIWKLISIETVTARHKNRAAGMMYGLEFPWNEEMLIEFGPRWLTEAFRRAGTIDDDNSVTQVIVEQRVKITGGNNGGKFLFEVKYARRQPHLHSKLFAKVPFACTPATMSDRLSSSVYKQPMDFAELNSYRLLEASFPMAIPKFYYGDISNETSNFILITERIMFADVGGRRQDLKPFEIEGPYDKCKDWQLRSPAKEYYMLLMEVSGQMAGYHKAGQLGDDKVLRLQFPFQDGRSGTGGWGGQQAGDQEQVRAKFEAGYKFVAETAKQLYPGYVTSHEFRKKFIGTLMTLTEYTPAIERWKSADPDYSALGHQNLNTDNAYFWKDESGKLHVGVFDFGGFGSNCLPHKLWWALNMADFENVKTNLHDYIDAFIAAYKNAGGPSLEHKVVHKMIILTALQNLVIMINAIPNNFKMCPLKEWATIKDRHDPRIANDIDNKSTLRSCVHVLGMGCCVIEELNGPEVLAEFVEEKAREAIKAQKKADEDQGRMKA